MGRDLLLALGLSSALHAAVLSSLEPPLSAAAPKPVLTVQFSEEKSIRAPVPADAPRQRAATPRSRAVLPIPYLPLHEVHTPARPRSMVPLVYPENPLIWKLAGVVRLRLRINEHGTVDTAEVISAEPQGEFEEAALAAARRLVYDPALRHGVPVKSEKIIEVTFDPQEAPPR